MPGHWTLLPKLVSNLRRNLAICHLVSCLHGHDASTESVSLKTLLQLALRLTRTEYQNRFGITNGRDDLIVVIVQMARKPSLAAIVCRNVL